ncbi:MAG: response regulator transcription factor [Chloroflexota bacterium]
MVIRLVVAEDHHVVRTALVGLLNAEPDLAVVGEAADGTAVFHRVASCQPDLLLLDANMPQHQPVQNTQALLQAHPQLRILILSAYKQKEIVTGLLNAGAAGYVLKDDSHETLLQAVRTVASGGRWVSPQVVDVLVAQATQPNLTVDLTPREREVLKLLAEGQRNQEIAETLGVTHQSVRNYVQRVYRKIGVETRVEATLFALKRGIAKVDA